MAANGESLKCKPPFAEFGDSTVIAELPLVTAIPTETGDVEVRRSTGVNRRDHHRAGIISSKHSDINRLRPCVGMALPLIELPFCDVRGVEDTNSAVSVEVTAVRWQRKPMAPVAGLFGSSISPAGAGEIIEPIPWRIDQNKPPKTTENPCTQPFRLAK